MPGAILFVAPFAWLISASFQPIGEIFSSPPHWIPDEPDARRLQAVPRTSATLTEAQEAQGTATGAGSLNSAFVAITITVLQTFFNALCAYVFAKRKFPGRDIDLRAVPRAR